MPRPTLERALAEALGPGPTRATVLRASKLPLVLPPGIVEVPAGEPGYDVHLAVLDAATLADAATALAAMPAGQRVAWAMPVARPGVVAWIASRARGVGPVLLEDACDALRRAGVVDVRVTETAGALPAVVVTGLTSEDVPRSSSVLASEEPDRGS